MCFKNLLACVKPRRVGGRTRLPLTACVALWVKKNKEIPTFPSLCSSRPGRTLSRYLGPQTRLYLNREPHARLRFLRPHSDRNSLHPTEAAPRFHDDRQIHHRPTNTQSCSARNRNQTVSLAQNEFEVSITGTVKTSERNL